MSFIENCDQVANQLSAGGIVPVLVIDKLADGIKMLELLHTNGLKVAEITFRTKAAAAIIKYATSEFPDMQIGAGTILNTEDLGRAIDAGSSFAVAPGFNPNVVRAAMAKELPFFPGVCTPSGVEIGLELGLKIFKFFPAEAVGGIAMLNSLIAPYKHLGVRFMPTGGIKPTNVGEYLAIPEIIGCGGTWIGKSSHVAAGDWHKIEQIIIEAVALGRNN